MKHIVICILFQFIAVISTHSQTNYDYYTYRQYYNKATLAAFEKKYQQACYYYKEAFNYGNKYLPDNLHLEEYASCLLEFGDTLNSLETLKKAIVKGSYAENIRISKKFSKKHWDMLLKQIPDLKSQYWIANIPDIDNIIEIRKLGAIDQAVRNNFEGRVSEDSLNKLIDITDSVNFFRLKQLVSEKGASAGCFLMMHLYGNNQKYVPFYDSILRREIPEGKVSPEFYIFWYDRQRIYVEGKTTQIFGQYNFFNYGQKNYSPDLNPIDDIENVDKRRAELGLMSLEDWARVQEGTLPDAYKKLKAKSKK